MERCYLTGRTRRVFGVTESNEARGRKKGSLVETEARVGREDGPRKDGPGTQQSTDVDGCYSGVDVADGGDKCDDFSLDEDPRVVIGLNRVIEAVVKAHRNSKLVKDDD